MIVEKSASTRRTFAIISHPDAGKTTITEKLLLMGDAINMAGTVKARKSDRHAKSDWMAMEKQRGISVTTSVMQFPYRGRIVNLLDTPGHEDFSEDTYRTLTAVDSALMVIDGSKGVESRTIKLLEVCRMRDTPIVTFINKLDREILDPIELLDEVERILSIECAPVTWPIGMGRNFKGCYHLLQDRIYCFEPGHGHSMHKFDVIEAIDSEEARLWMDDEYDAFIEEIELVKGASYGFDIEAFQEGRRTPVFFGTALANFGVEHTLDSFVEIAPSPKSREADARSVGVEEEDFTGFVFKIQANMDPRHRDRIAFMRVCSGRYRHGMRMHHVRLNRDVKVTDAVTFMAGDRVQAEEAFPGDIIGLHNHGSIRIGDSFTEGEKISFKGVPNFAPELFRRVRPRDPLRSKQLEKGIKQLSEEGAMQAFFPVENNEIIVGAVGTLQFDLVSFRLADEYKADCVYEVSQTIIARWVTCESEIKLEEFKRKNNNRIAVDGGGCLAFLATSQASLQVIEERWPEIIFSSTREHSSEFT